LSFNSEKYIKYMVESVISQTYKPIEFIVVDGGSKDKTLDIIKNFKNKIDVLISEPDKGVFDALNKGIKVATGEIIGWLGSEDFFPNDRIVEAVIHQFGKRDIDICWGDLVYIERDNNKIKRFWRSSNYKKGKFKFGWQLPHFSSFIKKEIFEKYGYFNINLKISSDYELFLRFLEKHNIKSHYIPKVLMVMRTGGQSNKNIRNVLKGNYECYLAWKFNKMNIFPFYFLTKPIYKFLQLPLFHQNKSIHFKSLEFMGIRPRVEHNHKIGN